MGFLSEYRRFVVTFAILVSCSWLVKSQTDPPINFDYDCWFEISIGDAWCYIRNDDTNDFDWMRKTSDDPSFTDPEPSTDHSTYEVHGHYLYAPTGKNANGDYARLNLPTFEDNVQNMCLQFFYQIDGGSSGGGFSFNMYQYTSTDGMPASPTWSTTAKTGDVWTRATYTITPQMDTYKVILEAVAGTSNTNFVAVDDVGVTRGTCALATFTCTFEEGECMEQDKTDEFDWIIMQGATLSTYTGPTADHTFGNESGHYMYVEASYYYDGQKGRLQSPLIQAPTADDGGEVCIRFWYHMYGASVGTLNLYVREPDMDLGDALWTKIGNRGDVWRGGEFRLKDTVMNRDFQAVFEVVRGRSYDGDVALDDIDIRRCGDEPAPEDPAEPPSCDFEEPEICDYIQDQTDDADWIWQNRANALVLSGPTSDHTFGNEFGFYMFINGGAGNRKTARLYSLQDLNQGSCVEFYFNLYGNDDQQLNIYCGTIVGDNLQLPDDPLQTLTGSYGDRWVRSTVTNSGSRCRLVFEGRTGIHSRDDVAIDDVRVYSGSCPSIPPTQPIVTTTPTPVNNIACTFENDLDDDPLCGWTEDARDSFDWTLWKGPSRDYQSGPPNDHTKQDETGHYLLIDTYNALQPNTRAAIRSPLVQATSAERCFTLWYYMDSTYTHFLNIYLQPHGSALNLDPVLQLFGNNGPQWKQLNVPLPASSRNFYVVLEGTIGKYTYSADIGVDDFSLSSTKCDATPQNQSPPTVANCDFESGMCGYRQVVSDSYSDDFDWFMNMGQTGTDGTGPSSDHTLMNADGHYLYMEASQPRRQGDTAQIVTPVITAFNETYCLEFFYHMSGVDTATLRVIQQGDYYNPQEIASLVGPIAMEWTPFNVDVPKKYGNIEIVFEGMVGNSYRGDIALDDITFTPMPCGGYPTETSCMFEYGFRACSFETSLTDTADWKWFDVLVGGTSPASWQNMGSYMYVLGTNQTAGSTSVLKTQWLTIKENDHCLDFDYAVNKGMKLEVIAEGRDGSLNTLQTNTKSTNKAHSRITLTTSAVATQYRITFKATQDTDNMGLAAFDNVAIDYCNSGNQQEGGSSDSTVGVVLGILLGVAALIIVAVCVLHYRSKSESTPTSIAYKTDTLSAPEKPDLSKDPGIDNPNYTAATLTV